MNARAKLRGEKRDASAEMRKETPETCSTEIVTVITPTGVITGVMFLLYIVYYMYYLIWAPA